MFASVRRLFAASNLKPSVSDVRKHKDFSHLSDGQLAKLVRSAKLSKLAVGEIIATPPAGEARRYLFKGKVRVCSARHEFILDIQGASEGLRSLDELLAESGRIECLTPTFVLAMPTALVGVSHEAGLDDWVETPHELAVDDLSLDLVSEIEGSLAREIMRDVKEERLTLPTMPELGLAVRRKAMDPSSSAIDLTRIIQVDVTIAAKVIQIANSPVYAGYESTKTLNEAIARMGMMAVQDVVTALTIKQLFVTKQPRLRRRMRNLWEHSTRVAAGASVLARHAGTIDPEQALLAGLVHDIGELAIIQYANQSNLSSISDADLDAAVKHLKGPLGAMLLRHWGLDEEFVIAARFADEFDKQTPHGILLLDLVQVSQLHAQAGTSMALSLQDITQLPAIIKLGLATEGPEKSISLLREARAEIETIRLALAL